MISSNEIRVSDYICQTLVSEGIQKAFLITGGGSMHLNDAIVRNKKIEHHFMHHEQSLSMAAEGYSRITNNPALVNITTGPGVVNSLNGVYGAFVDSIPMFVVSGQVRTETIARLHDKKLRQLGDQEVDTYSMVKPVVKYYALISKPEEVKTALSNCIYHLKKGRPGPVWLDVPIDIQSKNISIKKKLISYSKSKKNIKLDYIHENQKKININYDHLKKDIRFILNCIKKSKRPTLLIGSGVRISSQVDRTLRILKKLKIPVCVGWNSNDIIPNNNECFVGKPGTVGDRSGNFSIYNSDLVLVLGCRLNIRQISYNWKSFAKNAKLLMVDIDQSEIKKHTLKVYKGFNYDLKFFLTEFENMTINWKKQDAHLQFLNWCKKIKKNFPIIQSKHFNKGKVNPYGFFEELYQNLSSKDIVVLANGTACVVGLQTSNIKKGMRVFTNSGSASMGYDLPAAIGASIASEKKKRVICVAGDGSLMMNIQEIATMKYKNLPIKLFILGNKGYHSIRQTQKNYFSDNLCGTSENDGLGFPDFIKVGIAFGIKSKKISSIDELKKHIKSKDFNNSSPQIIYVELDEKQNFEPKLQSRKLEDGSLLTPELHDMFPFLSEKEIKDSLI